MLAQVPGWSHFCRSNKFVVRHLAEGIDPAVEQQSGGRDGTMGDPRSSAEPLHHGEWPGRIFGQRVLFHQLSHRRGLHQRVHGLLVGVVR